ncbi:MAG TPA: ribonuclease P protein component [Bacillales bacterium]|nr:ribonuclease P protein component [Bacillales bacterium]
MKTEYRLKKNNEFQFVFQTGASKANRQFVVYYTDQPNNEHFRVGISVSKRVGNAVTRNRIKRHIRELIRLMESQISDGKDYVIIARKPTADMDYHEMKKSLVHVLKRAGVLRNHSGGSRG